MFPSRQKGGRGDQNSRRPKSAHAHESFNAVAMFLAQAMKDEKKNDKAAPNETMRQPAHSEFVNQDQEVIRARSLGFLGLSSSRRKAVIDERIDWEKRHGSSTISFAKAWKICGNCGQFEHQVETCVIFVLPSQQTSKTGFAAAAVTHAAHRPGLLSNDASFGNQSARMYPIMTTEL